MTSKGTLKNEETGKMNQLMKPIGEHGGVLVIIKRPEAAPFPFIFSKIFKCFKNCFKLHSLALRIIFPLKKQKWFEKYHVNFSVFSNSSGSNNPFSNFNAHHFAKFHPPTLKKRIYDNPPQTQSWV
jgi:hypothetical protein